MQKKLIALAIAGLAAVPAFAQSNVTIYGRVDYGFVSRGGESGGLTDALANKKNAEFASGVQGGSRIGFKGAEDLGNGLKAIFEVEYGISNDENATFTSNRHSYVGLTGGFGTVLGGRVDGARYGLFNTYDPFAGGTVGNFTQMTAQVDRANNAIAYVSPTFSGLNVLLAYATHIGPGLAGAAPGTENPGNDGDQRLNTIMLNYDNGPISAKLDYERIKIRGIEGDLTVTTAGGSYDFGVAKVSALYDILRSDFAGVDAEQRAWLVGARVPFGKFTGKIAYGRVQDKEVDDADSAKWAVGVDYELSKRTNFYADYGRINNDDGAARAINYSAGSDGAGFGARGIDIGIAHKF